MRTQTLPRMQHLTAVEARAFWAAFDRTFDAMEKEIGARPAWGAVYSRLGSLSPRVIARRELERARQ